MNSVGTTQSIVPSGAVKSFNHAINHRLDGGVQYVKEKQRIEALEKKYAKLLQEKAALVQQKAQIQSEEVVLKATANKERHVLMINLFLAVFGQKLTLTKEDDEQISAFATQYGFDTDFCVVIQEQKSMISSMAPFIHFLKEHQEIKSCDFKGITVVHDVETLAQYLKDPQSANRSHR